MCGRYAASSSPDDLIEEFEIDRLVSAPDEPDYNVAPTKPVPAVIERRRAGDPGGEPAGPAGPGVERQLHAVRWGLVPFWAETPKIGSRLINARVETVASKPAFRRAFAARRCLLPADGYYEWYGPAGPDGGRAAASTPGRRGRKQPFFIRPRDGGVLAMAGLYEKWRDESRSEDDPAGWLWTATVLTTEAEDELGHLHDRMPLLVEPGQWAGWLDPATDDPAELLDRLTPAAPGRLEAYPVSTSVNDVANNGPQLVVPLPAEPPEQPEPAGPASSTDQRDTLF